MKTFNLTTTEGQSLLRDLQDYEFRKRSHDLFKLLQKQVQVSVDITIISVIVAHYSNSYIYIYVSRIKRKSQSEIWSEFASFGPKKEMSAFKQFLRETP